MRFALILCSLALLFTTQCTVAVADEDNSISDLELRKRVVRAMRDGCAFLTARQDADGSWQASGSALWGANRVGYTSIAILALINNDYPVDSEPVQRGLQYLRSLGTDEPNGQHAVYQASLMVMALCAVDDLRTDYHRISRLATELVQTQSQTAGTSGMWGYKLAGKGGTPGANGEDRSNTQFAILALRDAAYAGVRIERDVWKRAHEHWIRTQLPNGGWSYRNDDSEARGSMTVGGLSSLAITNRMLQDDSDVNDQGTPDCCRTHEPIEAFEKARRWLGTPGRFTVTRNPEFGQWHHYYLYGLERAGRLGNVRLFGNFDWYRSGARFLAASQHGDGSWDERGVSEPVVNTAFALLFLSKGLSRVIINKLDYVSPPETEEATAEWNQHPLDVTNLTELVDGLQDWPPRLTSQVLKLSRLRDANAVADMNQAPVLYLSGRDAPELTDQHVLWLREYVDEGGFIFAVANCQGGTFDSGLRQLVERMFPSGAATLQRLTPDHAVFRSEFNLPENVELHGVDFGCRTAIMYSPDDLGCYWQKWMKHNPRNRHPGLSQQILRATRIGVNVLAYATGREPPIKLKENQKQREAGGSKIKRGLLEIAQLRHSGGWDTAPKALRNLLLALNETVGMSVSPQRRTIPITLAELRAFPLVYMHGRYRFRLAEQERNALRDHLSRGPVLFADACCGSDQFDRSFRDLMELMYPDNPLQPIPVDHELFSNTLAHQIDRVSLRRLMPSDAGATMKATTQQVPPQLEGILIDGRYAVIYSRYDISCALENQASLACDGYLEQDAMKLAVNAVLYAMLQDISWSQVLNPGTP